MKRNRKIYCINCSKEGHIFRNCKEPIASYGILAYRIVNKEYQFLLIQRKDTMGYIDFIRGKYPIKNKELYLKVFIEEMIPEEHTKIKTLDFDVLWEGLWLNKKSKQYLNDYKEAKERYNQLDILNLFNNTQCKYKTKEYGIPKGRKNTNELNITCAMREFNEETGYNNLDYALINKEPIEEVFIGSNNVIYKHVYYIAKMRTLRSPVYNPTCISQAGEISNISWFSYKDCLKVIRDYDVSKRNIITLVYKYLNKSG